MSGTNYTSPSSQLFTTTQLDCLSGQINTYLQIVNQQKYQQRRFFLMGQSEPGCLSEHNYFDARSSESEKSDYDTAGGLLQPDYLKMCVGSTDSIEMTQPDDIAAYQEILGNPRSRGRLEHPSPLLKTDGDFQNPKSAFPESETEGKYSSPVDLKQMISGNSNPENFCFDVVQVLDFYQGRPGPRSSIPHEPMSGTLRNIPKRPTEKLMEQEIINKQGVYELRDEVKSVIDPNAMSSTASEYSNTGSPLSNSSPGLEHLNLATLPVLQNSELDEFFEDMEEIIHDGLPKTNSWSSTDKQKILELERMLLNSEQQYLDRFKIKTG